MNCPSRTITLIIWLFLVQDVRDTMCQWWLTAWEYCDRMDIRIVTVEYLVEEEEVTPIHSSQLGSQLQTDGDWLRDYRLRIIINIYLGIWDQTSLPLPVTKLANFNQTYVKFIWLCFLLNILKGQGKRQTISK